jgi:hypothetical protein
MDIFRLGEPSADVHAKQSCSLDKVSVPSCFLYDAEALIIGAMMAWEVKTEMRLRSLRLR